MRIFTAAAASVNISEVNKNMKNNYAGDMLLYGMPAESISIGDRSYRIYSGFRAVLGVLHYIELTGDMNAAAKLFFRDEVADDETAVKMMKGFIGEEFIPDSRKAFSFYGDAELLAGAFMQCYGIDIFSADMHWHRFRALFLSLDGECAFSQLIKCRTGNFPDTEQRLAVRRLCRKYDMK